MTFNRDKKQDIKITNEHIQNKENVFRKNRSWLDHTEGAADIDYDLLQGATLEQMMKSTGRSKSSVKNHFQHLKIEHGITISENNGVYMVEKSTLKENNIMGLTETYLKEFAQIADDWFKEQTWLQKRYDYFQKFFTAENLEKTEWSDFQEMGNNIHAFVNMQIAKANALGRINLDSIEDYRRIFKYIVSNNEPINITINNLEATDSSFKLPYFGDSAISELIAYAYPEKYVTYNTRDIQALEILGIKLKTIKKEKFGEKFLRYNEVLTPVLEQYKSIVGPRTNTTIPLELDQFFSWLYETKKNDKPIIDMIARYKEHIIKNGLDGEKYKWEMIRDQLGHPNVEADDFVQEVNNIDFQNMAYYQATTISQIVNDDQEFTHALFKSLFDENNSIEDRVKNFIDNCKKRIDKILPGKSSGQDERTISVYLALHDPEKYTFYKSSYYKDYCELIGEKPARSSKKKYPDYLERLKTLAENYISKDKELLSLASNSLGDLMNLDPNYLLLGQDILFQVSVRELNQNYWIFQGNPKIYDLQGAVNDDALSSWSVKAHKNKIVEGDKVIFWLTGDKPGCYALGKVTTEVYKARDDENDFAYYIDKKENELTERVGVNITHNLVETPILKSEIKENPALKKLKAGNQGTNFLASKEEYEAILDLINKSTNPFEKVLSRFDSNSLKIYFSFLKEIIQKFNLEIGDERLVFSIKYNSLNFIIGQRYCWNLFPSEKRGKFGVISKEKLSPESETFTGSSKDLYYNFYNEINFESSENKLIFSAISDQLNRTNKSSYYRHNNIYFEKHAFNYLSSISPNKNIMEPINKILFGPPGTGKTYKLKNELFKKYTTKETSISPEKHFKNVVKELSWWQVIALALLEIGKSKVGVIYDNRWVKQKVQLSESKTIRQTLWGQLQSHTVPECEFVNVKSRQTPYLFNKTEDSFWEILHDEVKEQTPELYDIRDSVDNFIPNPDKEIKRYIFTTFHQSFSYEDFIEGIKPKMQNGEEETEDLTYEIQPGVFKQLCTDAQSDPENKYAIFIDEINRGNISNIFGELITLIEPDKRLGAINSMSAILPYSKKEFSVPINVDIIGTMNTADRSVEALDTALRRRFSFQEIMPNPSLLNNYNIEGYELKKVLEKINERIEVLIDRDHTIGHSYFLQVDSLEKLKLVFKDNIIPLLQEYFYGDYGKIGLVLGNGFVTYQPEKNELFANFDDYERKDELNNGFYILKNIDENFDLIYALNELLNIKTSEIRES